MSYLSSGHKIGDIVGRKKKITCLQEKIAEVIEHNYSLGNTIYKDDDGIFFMIPYIPSTIDLDNTDFDKLSEYGKLLQEIKREIAKEIIEETKGDISPKFHFVQDTKYMTHLVLCMKELKQKSEYPVYGASQELINKIKDDWKSNSKKLENKEVCPLCRRRPVEEKKEPKICNECNEIRKSGGIFKDIALSL